MQEKINAILEELMKKFEDVKTLQELNDLRVAYQGKKGVITDLSAGIKDVPNEEKKEYGIKLNKIRTSFNTLYEEKLNILNLEEIRLIVFSHNERAIRCYQRLGFEEYNRITAVTTRNNHPVDDIYMRLRRN